MTHSQLEHLRLIDAHLTALLDLAAKRTPGEWSVEDRVEVRTRGGASFVTDCYEDGEHDAAFIASCAGNAEAGWRSTKASVALLLVSKFVTPNSECNALVNSILAAWPIEKLKLP